MLVRCPTCKKRSPWEENPWRPFCSERCKMSDLGKWATEEYRIDCPLEDGDDDAEKRNRELADQKEE